LFGKAWDRPRRDGPKQRLILFEHSPEELGTVWRQISRGVPSNFEITMCPPASAHFHADNDGVSFHCEG